MASELVPLHRLEESDASLVWGRDTQLKVIPHDQDDDHHGDDGDDDENDNDNDDDDDNEDEDGLLFVLDI